MNHPEIRANHLDSIFNKSAQRGKFLCCHVGVRLLGLCLIFRDRPAAANLLCALADMYQCDLQYAHQILTGGRSLGFYIGAKPAFFLSFFFFCVFSRLQPHRPSFSSLPERLAACFLMSEESVERQHGARSFGLTGEAVWLFAHCNPLVLSRSASPLHTDTAEAHSGR